MVGKWHMGKAPETNPSHTELSAILSLDGAGYWDMTNFTGEYAPVGVHRTGNI